MQREVRRVLEAGKTVTGSPSGRGRCAAGSVKSAGEAGEERREGRLHRVEMGFGR